MGRRMDAQVIAKQEQGEAEGKHPDPRQVDYGWTHCPPFYPARRGDLRPVAGTYFPVPTKIRLLRSEGRPRQGIRPGRYHLAAVKYGQACGSRSMLGSVTQPPVPFSIAASGSNPNVSQ